ncbi:MAG: 1,2-phenylacetyl-CoA epoxidase subunit PaaB [Gammaproteobacteria bacterium]
MNTTTVAAEQLFEVFVRPRAGLGHRHVGSVRATDAEMALQHARDCFTRRQEGVSIWVMPAAAIAASQPCDKETLFAPAADKKYRHPDFYEVPSDVEYI